MRRRQLTDLARLVRHAAELGLDEAHTRALRGAEPWDDLPVAERIRRGEALWRHAMERAGADLPVHLALKHELEDLGALGLAMRASETLGVAWERLLRYQELFLPMAMWRLADRSGRVRLALVWRPPLEPAVLRVSREFVAALFAHLNQQMGGPAPEAVTLDHEPEAVGAWAATFGVVPTRGEEAALIYPAGVWDRPLLRPDPAVAAFVVGELEALAARPQETGDFLYERLRDILRRRLPSGPPPMPDVARELGTSERTLRRRLEETGATYADIVDRTREEAARELVRRTDHSLSEIAYLLGFSEPSAFHRAFKRWTGVTPARFRRS